MTQKTFDNFFLMLEKIWYFIKFALTQCLIFTLIEMVFSSTSFFLTCIFHWSIHTFYILTIVSVLITLSITYAINLRKRLNNIIDDIEHIKFRYLWLAYATKVQLHNRYVNIKYPYKTGEYVYPEDSLKQWVYENCSGLFRISDNFKYIYFLSSADAVLFKMAEEILIEEAKC